MVYTLEINMLNLKITHFFWVQHVNFPGCNVTEQPLFEEFPSPKIPLRWHIFEASLPSAASTAVHVFTRIGLHAICLAAWAECFDVQKQNKDGVYIKMKYESVLLYSFVNWGYAWPWNFWRSGKKMGCLV